VHVLALSRGRQEVPYQAYISQISYLLFLKRDDERPGLVASGLIECEASAVPEDCRWPVLRDLQGEQPSGGGRVRVVRRVVLAEAVERRLRFSTSRWASVA
jgi:hypothetical protein